MADKNFFDLLKDKLAALRPAETYRQDDWAVLGERLNAVLPQSPRKRQRAILLPLLLVAALLSSNAAWWQSNRSDRAALARLDAQMAGWPAMVLAAPDTVVRVAVRTDTVWRTVYVQRVAGSAETRFGNIPQHGVASERHPTVRQHERRSPVVPGAALNGHDSNNWKDKVPAATNITSSTNGQDQQKKETLNADDSLTQLVALRHLEVRQVALQALPKREVALPQHLIITPLKAEKTTKPSRQTRLAALRPKYFKLGANIGWLYAKSSGLMHEGGFANGINGVVGLSRHWSLTAAYGAGQLHYKAHDSAAILSAPALPTPDHGYHVTEIDVTGQKIRQFNLGLRYTFAQPGKLRPFLGLGWGSLTVLPYDLEYETEQEHTGTIQKGVFSISEQTRLRNILHFGAGLDIPLSSRFDLTLEGFYLRQWKKPSGTAPDLMNVRVGVNWLF